MSELTAKDKVNIIKVASTGPLAFYAAVAVITVAGLLTSLAVVQRYEVRLSIVLGVSLIILVMVFFAGFSLIKKSRSTGMDFPSHGSTLGNEAIKGFFAGGDASRLQGRWEVEWLLEDDTGNRHPYTVKDRKTGEVKPYPKEIASIKSHGAMISVENHDPTTQYVYYMEGRMSVKGTVTLIFWSKAGVDESMLVGTLFLTADFSYHAATLSGTWTGYSREGKVTRGEINWRKMTKS